MTTLPKPARAFVARRAILSGISGLLLAATATSTAAQNEPPPDPPREPMLLGAASNFSQGWNAQLLARARALPVRHFRDGMRWGDVERRPGEYRFDRPQLNYPAELARAGGDLVLTVNWGNRLYDGGDTPHSPEAVAAFGRYVGELVERYPAITTIEVGNEFNSANFVSGPVRDAGLAERAAYHLAMLRSAAEAARAVRPDIEILGGSTHSIAAGYLWPILEQGGAALMDGLAIHPYTTQIDQLPGQIEVLRSNPVAASMPIAITEFGSEDAALAGDHLLRGYAALSSLGVASLYWYPLNDRGDGLIPLIERDGTITAAGEAFRFIETELADHPGTDLSPDPFTFVHAFGQNRLVLWGDPRSVMVEREDIAALDARGRPIALDQLSLQTDQAIVLTSERPIDFAGDVQLGCQTLVADSYYQFAYGSAAAPNELARFEPTVIVAGSQSDWVLMPGQQTTSVPWTPYLGLSGRRNIRLSADNVVLGQRDGETISVVFEFSGAPMRALQLSIAIEAGTAAPREFAAQIDDANGTREFRSEAGAISETTQISVTPEAPLRVTLSPSEPGGSVNLDYRLRLRDPNKCGSTP